MEKREVLGRLRGGLIVSCQAAPQEPLFGSSIMAAMADAAFRGGAAGIRANSAQDIRAIRKKVPLPVIGLSKKSYPDSEVYITPLFQDVSEIAAAGADIVALDATDRLRPCGEKLEDIVRHTRKAFPGLLLMADCATFEDGMAAAALGFDFIGTTLCGYTAATQGTPLPNFSLIENLSLRCGTPVIAEGGIWTPEELENAIRLGAFAAVVGTAITRPQEITKRFTAGLKAASQQAGL
ncbi:MAG: N-acetylmannosamine-6-phosphate 2-epimerase [Oscillospiraceae bacterium]|nr:N-acetylmannosamine-6-phosphate 2-epimerase [Oscillospiraceae bacterium]